MTGSQDAAAGIPAAQLRPFVRRYLGYRYLGFSPGIHLGLPSPYLTIVISLAAPTLVALDTDVPATGYATLASGLSTRPAYIPHDGDQFGVQLELTPAGARSLLGLPAAALADTVVGLEDLLGADATELPDRMADAGGWAERFAVLDEVLARRTGRLPAAAEPLTYTWHKVLRSGGAARIGDLAAEIGWSRRHLTARFSAEFGAGPKDVARIVRFERSKALLRRADRPTLASVAAASGYYDQPHLAREWRDLAGVAPSVWLAGEELPTGSASR